ncbi:glycosyltransferase family 4 protein [Tropicibacter sp. S64]|uniref:glycosyltransferase family 4 protein n=1 Tax=Tropicibacter sp. S64 TaxID=3415122 RepID=UPI003C7C6022
MARILFALPRFHTNLWFAARAMKTAGHELQFLVNKLDRGEDYSFVTPQALGKDTKQSDVTQIVDAFKPDIVFVRNAWSLSRQVAWAARGRAPTLLYNLQPLNQQTSLLRRAELFIKILPRHRITPVAGWPQGGSPDPFATYLPWPVAALPAPQPFPKPEGKLHLVCVGKLGLPRKNQPQLIEAMAAAGLDRHYHVTLVGSAPKPDLPGQKAHAARIDAIAKLSWVTLRSGIAYKDMANLYTTADVCVLPSFDEPLGISPVEAMAYGAIPVISSDSGSAGYIRQGENGFVVDMHHPETAADALLRIAEDPELRQTLSAEARRTTETELSEATFLQRLDAILADRLPA